jgi:hypothetical protein
MGESSWLGRSGGGEPKILAPPFSQNLININCVEIEVEIKNESNY